MDKGKVLVVEDETDIRELIRYHLERENYRVVAAASGEEGLDLAKRQPFDLVVLDVMLPGMDGLEVCRRLRTDGATRATPILMLTARTEEADIVSGLEIGADDYVTKPFRPRVLLARIKAVLRRKAAVGAGMGAEAEERDSADGEVLRYRDLTIDFPRHQASLAGEPLTLTLTEFKILAHLLRRPGRVFRRDEILDAIQGTDSFVLDRTIDVHIAALRRKLGSLGSRIETVRGVGYRLADA
ncbi:MAG: response regulator [Candidatus Eisenbacteria bacterium]|nr:response regulator transcription factor [Candidatus Eisenbacteria bacterium]